MTRSVREPKNGHRSRSAFCFRRRYRSCRRQSDRMAHGRLVRTIPSRGARGTKTPSIDRSVRYGPSFRLCSFFCCVCDPGHVRRRNDGQTRVGNARCHPGSARWLVWRSLPVMAWTPRSRAACAAATPRSVTSFTASSLNSRVNFRLSIAHLRFHKTPNSVSSKPGAAQIDLAENRVTTTE
jgi:hypothetical protein